MKNKTKNNVEEKEIIDEFEVIDTKTNKKNPQNNVTNISYKLLAKRVLAYMIDILIVTIIGTLISSIPILNKKTDKYQELYDEYQEIYTEYTDTIVSINDLYEDEEITKEEYQSLIETERYANIFKEKYSDEIINKDELEDITKQINQEYTKIAESYTYKLQKLGIYNSVITLICTLLYFGVLQYFLKGESIGKKVMSLKIVSINGNKVNILKYIIRSLIVNNVLLNSINILFLAFAKENIFNKVDSTISLLTSIVEAIIIFLVITREDNRGLHDLLCNTKVISTKED